MKQGFILNGPLKSPKNRGQLSLELVSNIMYLMG